MRLRRKRSVDRWQADLTTHLQAAGDRLDQELTAAPISDGVAYVLAAASQAAEFCIEEWAREVMSLELGGVTAVSDEVGLLGLIPDQKTADLLVPEAENGIYYAVELPWTADAPYRAVRAASWVYAVEYWARICGRGADEALDGFVSCNLLADSELDGLRDLWDLGKYLSDRLAGEAEGTGDEVDSGAVIRFERLSYKWVLSAAYQAEAYLDVISSWIWSHEYSNTGMPRMMAALDEFEQRDPSAFPPSQP